jgi:hypothetical protein
MKHLFSIVIFSIFGCTLAAGQQQQDTLHKEWVQLDLELFKSISKIDKNKPQEVEQFFEQLDPSLKKDTLGFDWQLWSTGKAGGYVSIQADFYYYKGQIASYKLYSRLPYRRDLINQYRELYPVLLPEHLDRTYFYSYEPKRLLKPLIQYRGHRDITPQMANYMLPTPQLTYGIAGGLPVTPLYNRQLFNALKNNLSNNQIVALMYAINPVSRLTAIEYYYKHKKEFSNRDKIDLWIEQVYKAKPVVETINGCFVYNEDARKLVELYSKIK